jgi:hypothetical protein
MKVEIIISNKKGNFTEMRTIDVPDENRLDDYDYLLKLIAATFVNDVNYEDYHVETVRPL